MAGPRLLGRQSDLHRLAEAPLRSAVASVPWATSLPAATIGLVYGATYLSLGMTFSATGSFAAGLMWSLILACHRPAGAAGRSFLPTDAAGESI